MNTKIWTTGQKKACDHDPFSNSDLNSLISCFSWFDEQVKNTFFHEIISSAF